MFYGFQAKLDEEEKRREAASQEAAKAAEQRDTTIKRLRGENTGYHRAQVRAESQAADATERAEAAEGKATFESAAAAAVKVERDTWIERAEDAQRSASSSRELVGSRPGAPVAHLRDFASRRRRAFRIGSVLETRPPVFVGRATGTTALLDHRQE